MSEWTIAHRDTDKTIERRQIGTNADGAVFEERTTWHNPDHPEARLDALTQAVDTLILDTLGGL